MALEYETCLACEGSGSADGEVCGECDGQGSFSIVFYEKED